MKYIKQFKKFESYSEIDFEVKTWVEDKLVDKKIQTAKKTTFGDYNFSDFTSISSEEFSKLKSLSNISIVMKKVVNSEYKNNLYSQEDFDYVYGTYDGEGEFSIYKLRRHSNPPLRRKPNEFILQILNVNKSYKCDSFESLLDLLKEKEYIIN